MIIKTIEKIKNKIREAESAIEASHEDYTEMLVLEVASNGVFGVAGDPDYEQILIGFYDYAVAVPFAQFIDVVFRASKDIMISRASGVDDLAVVINRLIRVISKREAELLRIVELAEKKMREIDEELKNLDKYVESLRRKRPFIDYVEAVKEEYRELLGEVEGIKEAVSKAKAAREKLEEALKILEQ